MKRFIITIETGECFTVLSPFTKQQVIESVWLRMQIEVVIIKVGDEDE